MDPDVDSQIIPIWGEFGYAGVIVFLGFIIFCFFYFYIEYRHARDMQLKAFSFVSMTGTVFLLFGFYVAHVWETQTVFGTLMMFYGLFYLRRKEIRAQVSSGVKQREII
jgi:O-antigen ligase